MQPGSKRVLLVRGHHPTVWGLRPFERLPERFDVRVVTTDRLRYDLDGVAMEQVKVRRSATGCPRGTLFDYASLVLRDRFRGEPAVFGEADIVHSEELSLWFTADVARLSAARLQARRDGVGDVPAAGGLPHPARPCYRRGDAGRGRPVLPREPTRARHGCCWRASPTRRSSSTTRGSTSTASPRPPANGAQDEHGMILLPARLEWEKGHQDVLRALALLRRGPYPEGRADASSCSSGGARGNACRAYAAELGIADAVQFRARPVRRDAVPVRERVVHGAGSLPRSGCALHPGTSRAASGRSSSGSCWPRRWRPAYR